jgi:hypothetical protein
MTKDEISSLSINRKIVFIIRKLVFASLFLILPILSVDTTTQTFAIVPKSLENYVNFAFILFMFVVFIRDEINFRKNDENQVTKIDKLFKSKIIEIAEFLYSAKTQKEVFEPIVADWQQELDFERLFNKGIWKARWINVRYTYAFLAAMWQKSPIGDLIEFVVKIAKQ